MKWQHVLAAIAVSLPTIASAQHDSAIEALCRPRTESGGEMAIVETRLASVQAYERATKKQYIWSDYTRLLAHRTDAIGHAADIARDRPALLIVHGTDDALLPAQNAIALRDALAPFYRESGSKKLRLELVDGLSHGWAESAHGDELRQEIAQWFKVSG